MAELCEKLKEYKDSDYYPFHMPGHKRNGYMTEKIFSCERKHRGDFKRDRGGDGKGRQIIDGQKLP